MACVVSLYISASLYTHKPPILQLDTRRSDAGKSLFPLQSPPVTTLMANCSNRAVVIVKGHHCRFLKPNTHFPKHISHHLSVSPTTKMVISGFWVGPDIEDGWGFVEAIVYQTC